MYAERAETNRRFVASSVCLRSGFSGLCCGIAWTTKSSIDMQIAGPDRVETQNLPNRLLIFTFTEIAEDRLSLRFPSTIAWFHTRQLSDIRSEEHTSELQSHLNLVCRLLLEKKKRMQ